MHEIAQVYDANPEDEWNRLVRTPYSQLEFAVFMHHITRHFPKRGLVMDAGGGPGRYAIALCERGLNVVLLDLSSGCIEKAKRKFAETDPAVQKRLKEFVVGNVTDLSCFDNAAFDAVLCLDPLSCMADPADREKALSEIVRVAKQGAIVTLAVRGYLDVVRTLLRIEPNGLLDGQLDDLTRTGNCVCRGIPHHFFRSTEFQELAERCGLETMLMAGGEGLSSGMPEATEALARNQDAWRRWLDLVIATSTDQAVVDFSGHMLYLGRKRTQGTLLR